MRSLAQMKLCTCKPATTYELPMKICLPDQTVFGADEVRAWCVGISRRHVVQVHDFQQLLAQPCLSKLQAGFRFWP